MGRVDLIAQLLTTKAVSAVLMRLVEHISNGLLKALAGVLRKDFPDIPYPLTNSERIFRSPSQVRRKVVLLPGAVVKDCRQLDL